MPDKFSIIEDQKLAIIHSFDDVSVLDISGSIQLIKKHFLSGDINKVLVDTTGQKNMPSSLNVYHLSDELPYGLKFALVTNPGQLTMEALKFFELTSSNKGKMLKVFQSEEEARLWLFE